MHNEGHGLDYDWLVVGSGLGGSVSALRLAQKGYRVGVLEQGKGYRDEEYAACTWQLRRWLWPGAEDIFLDLRLNGEFYLQTLMELLQVKDRIEGLIDFDGEITGPLRSITGRARARMKKGNLYTVDIDSLKCNVVYKNGVINFEDGYGTLYNGTAHADAVLHLLSPDGYTVNVKFQSIDSKGVFQLINWDPGIPNGKVDGELLTSGTEFNPGGWFVYKNPGTGYHAARRGNQPPTDDVLNRIRDIAGNYSVSGDHLTLANLQINTSQSRISANGSVDWAWPTGVSCTKTQSN